MPCFVWFVELYHGVTAANAYVCVAAGTADRCMVSGCLSAGQRTVKQASTAFWQSSAPTGASTHAAIHMQAPDMRLCDREDRCKCVVTAVVADATLACMAAALTDSMTS